MAVGPQAEVRQIQHGRRAADPLQRARIGPRGRLEVGSFDRHRVDLLRRKRRRGEEALAQVREVAVGVPRRRDPLVHLDDVDAGPWHVLGREVAQHQPRRVAAADGHDESAARRNRPAGVFRDDGRGSAGRGGGVGENLDVHDADQANRKERVLLGGRGNPIAETRSTGEARGTTRGGRRDGALRHGCRYETKGLWSDLRRRPIVSVGM